MKVLHPTGISASPLEREVELFRKIQAAGACSSERLRLTIAGRRLFLDGNTERFEMSLHSGVEILRFGSEMIGNQRRVGLKWGA